MKNYQKLLDQCTNSEEYDEGYVPDFNTIYNEVKNSYAKAMLLLFHISHIIVISQPGSTFDISYLQTLKAIELARQKCAATVTEILKSILDPTVYPEWISNRRLCTPRVVFYFEKCPKEIVRKGYSSIKKLEHAVEDKIYHIFRKAKVLINNR